jgi:hypothetical protein
MLEPLFVILFYNLYFQQNNNILFLLGKPVFELDFCGSRALHIWIEIFFHRYALSAFDCLDLSFKCSRHLLSKSDRLPTLQSVPKCSYIFKVASKINLRTTVKLWKNGTMCFVWVYLNYKHEVLLSRSSISYRAHSYIATHLLSTWKNYVIPIWRRS